jgi:glycerol-3-phosphate dehydrogenase
VGLVLRKLGHEFSRSQTATTPLPGAKDLSGFGRESPEAPEQIPPHWIHIYGSRAKEVATLARRLNNVFEAEIVFAFEQEFAKTLSDCFLRRTMMGLGPDLGLSKIEAAASVGVKLLGWSEERARREVESYRKEILRMKNRSFHG